MPLGKCNPHSYFDYKGGRVCMGCGVLEKDILNPNILPSAQAAKEYIENLCNVNIQDVKTDLRELVLTPAAPTTINEKGGKQSAVIHRCDLLPAKALLHLSEILKAGCDKYGKDNWRQIELLDHLNHALIHIFAYLDGNKQDDHLGHAACRMLMCLELGLS